MHTLHGVLAAATRLCVALALVLAPWTSSMAARALAAPWHDSQTAPAVEAPWPDSMTARTLAAPVNVATVTVGNGNFSYLPVTQTVLVNDTVQWVWTGDTFSHSTTSGSCSGFACAPDGKWTSALTSTLGFTFTQQFTQTGTYTYFCTNHGPDPFDMRGIIQVIGPITGLSAANSSPTPLSRVTAFTATVSSGNPMTYTWSFGDGQGGTGALTSHTYGAFGYFTAVVTASNPISTVVAFTPVTITTSIYLPLILR